MKRIFLLFLFVRAIAVWAQDLPKDYWSIVRCSSQENELFNKYGEGGGFAKYLIDNNLNTYWITEYKNRRKAFPFSVDISFGGEVELNGLRFYPRLNYAGGKIAGFEVFTSMDGEHWRLIRRSKFYWRKTYDNFPQTILFPPIHACFVRFVALNAYQWDDDAIATMAEIGALGKYICGVIIPRVKVNAPNVLPEEKVEILDSSVVPVMGNHFYKWSFPGGTPCSTTQQHPVVRYPKYGLYDITLTISSDENGKSSTRTFKNAVKCLPAPELCRNRWRIIGVSDEDRARRAGYRRLATCAIDNNPRTNWETSWVEYIRLPHFITIDLGEEKNVLGVGYLPRQVGINGKFRSFRIFVSSDTAHWGKEVASVTIDKPDTLLKIIGFEGKKGRYLKLVIDKTFSPKRQYAACSELYVYGQNVTEPNINYIVWAIVLLLLASLFFFFFYRLKRKSSHADDILSLQPDKYPFHINLFGKFSVEGHGKDYSALMYPKARLIFSLIAYKTFEEGGISTTDLTNFLWPELSVANAASTRSSNMRNLRLVLEDQDEIKISVNKNIWRVDISDKVYVDYLRYKQLSHYVEEMWQGGAVRLSLIEELVGVVERGILLTDLQIDWLDDLKNETSERIIEQLKSILNVMSKSLPSSLKLRLCSCLFLFDELSIEALTYRIKIHISENNLGMAKSLYNSFSIKYKSIYNEDFPKSFNDLYE